MHTSTRGHASLGLRGDFLPEVGAGTKDSRAQRGVLITMSESLNPPTLTLCHNTKLCCFKNK